ncbi:hypothetical protein LF599_14750 [Pseudodesulfovibrio thermohalotolerans]|uniref:hypothetical protein n=1 Tax=Pseudodesulfovibrio thermohalotolerans TaxID=2880651 RepID=UPI0022BA0FEB|nr:hypothetical protein [Pseudodesulfovibrio thermohalotolerans]WFS61912.1 hypothetical protein LF599_14750 [Pseudodesulfovibrio thermohalotolerans]
MPTGNQSDRPQKSNRQKSEIDGHGTNQFRKKQVAHGNCAIPDGLRDQKGRLQYIDQVHGVLLVLLVSGDLSQTHNSTLQFFAAHELNISPKRLPNRTRKTKQIRFPLPFVAHLYLNVARHESTLWITSKNEGDDTGDNRQSAIAGYQLEQVHGLGHLSCQKARDRSASV